MYCRSFLLETAICGVFLTFNMDVREIQRINEGKMATPDLKNVGNSIQFSFVNSILKISLILIFTISLKLKKNNIAVSEQFAFLSPLSKFPIFHILNLMAFTVNSICRSV